MWSRKGVLECLWIHCRLAVEDEGVVLEAGNDCRVLRECARVVSSVSCSPYVIPLRQGPKVDSREV